MKRGDDAITPLIGALILLMITVVIGLAVYAGTSRYGGEQQPPPRALTLASSTLVDADVKSYSIASATPGLRWNEVSVSVDGARLVQSSDPGCLDPGDGEWIACAHGATASASDEIGAGDAVKVHAVEDSRLDVVDLHANTVVFSALVR